MKQHLPNATTKLGTLLISCLLIGIPLSANPLSEVEHTKKPDFLQTCKEYKPAETVNRPTGCCAGPIKPPSA